MKRFLLYLLYFSIPFIFLLIIYVIIDPFKVVRDHNDYSTDLIPLNREAVCLVLFQKNNPEYHYNSFIMGNSRSIFYRTEDWKTHLGAANAVPFHFDASGDDIYGTWQKLRYIDQNGGQIKNLLWMIDHQSFYADPVRQGHLFVRAPALGSGESEISYQTQFLRASLNPKFLISLADYSLTGKERPYMREYLEFRTVKMIPESNDLVMYEMDDMLNRDAEAYYDAKKRDVFYTRDSIQTFSEPGIKNPQKNILLKIKTILDKHKTDYRIVINPLYDQKKLSPTDLQALWEIFGKDHIFDFSGINPITADFHNYYESSHYRPHAANHIMDSIYTNNGGQ